MVKGSVVRLKEGKSHLRDTRVLSESYLRETRERVLGENNVLCFFGQNFEMEADKPQPNLQMQAMMDEMRRLMTNEFNQLHERMDRIEAQDKEIDLGHHHKSPTGKMMIVGNPKGGRITEGHEEITI